MSISSVYMSIEKEEGLEAVKRCLSAVKPWEVTVKGQKWFVMGDMSSVSVANNRVETVEHLHHLDGYVIECNQA